MAPVFIKLDQLGIEPLGEDLAPADPGNLIERIRRHAETLQAQWQREREDEVAEQGAAVQRKDALAGS
jgi:hypothetical protein